MKNLNEVISNNIKELRKANKLTQYELAEKLNYSNKAISRWESGEVIPDVSTLNRLCEIFNIPLSRIFEENINIKKVKKYYKMQIGNKLAISLLAVLVVWLAATIVFVGFNITHNANYWQLFVWAIPCSCIVGVIFNSIWGKTMFNFLILSLLNWSTILAIYLTIQQYDLWVMFIVCLPIQVGILLWSNITKNNLNSRKQEENEK